MPYLHKIAHGLKKVANKYSVPVMFSAHGKLTQSGRCISGETSKADCKKRHGKHFMECAMAVVYEIPLSCGKSYISQTGRCVNDRLREHAKDLGKDDCANLVQHCSACKDSAPRFPEVKILSRGRLQRTCETVEAYYIKNAGLQCVSDTSLVLHSTEKKFLSHFLQ